MNDAFVYLCSVDGDLSWRFNPHSRLVTSNFQDRDGDIASDCDALIYLPGKYKHWHPPWFPGLSKGSASLMAEAEHLYSRV